MALKRERQKSYWTEATKESLFRESFGLPGEEEPLSEVHAILSLSGKAEAYSGKLYLTNSFLTFTSLDRRSCRLTLPLATVRRVEKLAPGQDGTTTGAFALSFTLFHGLRIVVQMNSLRPTNDAFCAALRTRLKAALPLMKSLKPFSKTFFSEWYLSPARDEVAPADPAVGELVEVEKEKGHSEQEWTTASGIDDAYHGGLGLVFKYPGDPRKLREKSKMKLWKEYLKNHGRNLTLIRYPGFNRLVQVGLPNRLRGEVWELTCGSLFLRLGNPGVYERILKENAGRTSSSTEDIEKDLHRSLPEYAAYQDPIGIDTMRRVLTAYSWSNPAVGYCQAMNLVVAAFLIYMSEEQCFWCLSVLCDRLLPEYYSPSMYGTVLDQRVFEHLVERCLPSIHEHFGVVDVQLSVASLPWFLSCFLASMPMVFALRIVDCFFLMGPKVLFQVSLAILKINGDELLAMTDDGAFINTMKTYFGTLGDSAHPKSTDPRVRQITKFQELLVVAFREFSSITDETIANERKRFRSEVVVSIENFAKRSTIRNLKNTGGLSKDEVGLIYDHFQLAALRSRSTPPRTSMTSARLSSKEPPPEVSTNLPSAQKDAEKTVLQIQRASFGSFLGQIATWGRDERTVRNGFHEHVQRTSVDHELIDRIFVAWDQSHAGSLSFQDVVNGLDSVLHGDLMSNISWLFGIHDNNKDGMLTKDEVLQLSESLLFIFRNEPGDRYLGSVSSLMHNLFEYAESTKVDDAGEEDDVPPQPAFNPDGSRVTHSRSASVVYQNPHRPYLGLATFRMCILADPLLEDFFDSDLTNSWKLEILVPEEKVKQAGPAGWLGGILTAVLTDENKERINRLADDVGKRLDVHFVEQRSSLGKLDVPGATLEPTTRDSLFPTNYAPRVPSKSPTRPPGATSSPLPSPPPPSTNTNQNPWSSMRSRDIDIGAAAASAFNERPHFVIDDAGDGDEEEEEAGEGDVLDQVNTFLATDDEGTTDARAGQELLSRPDGEGELL